MVASTQPYSAHHGMGGRVLLLARVVWLALAALQLLSFGVLLPAYFTLAQHPCPQNCALTAQQANALANAGIAPDAYVVVLIASMGFSVVIAAAIAFLLFLRRSQEWMALITAYVVLTLPTSLTLNLASSPTTSLQTTAFTLPPVADVALGAIQSGAIYGLFLLFPSGRFVPRWSWLLLAAFIIFTAIFSFWPELQDPLSAIWIAFFGGVIANMIYRYRRVSSPQEQQKTKWVIVGFITFLVTSLTFWLPTFTPLVATIYTPLSYLGYKLLMPVAPIAFFIAIQRYRLYDIDLIIRRTLVYGALTAALAVIYAIGVLGVQQVLQDLGGQFVSESQLTVVATTLLVVALFQPLRRSIQALIDRRFYRRRFNAQQTVARFSTTLRSDLDLDHIADELVGIVDETMLPAHISLWIQQRNDRPRSF